MAQHVSPWAKDVKPPTNNNNQSTLYFHQKQYIKTIIKNTHTQKPYGGVDWKANKAC